MKFSDLSHILYEIVGRRTLERTPEPTATMDAVDQVDAYEAAASESGALAGTYVWQTTNICRIMQDQHCVADLGCGTGRQLCMVARMLPDVTFVGFDMSVEMLARASRHAESLGLRNVELVQSDITNPLPNQWRFDGVMSTLAFHHLPTSRHLKAALLALSDRFASDRRCGVYISDLLRPKSEATVTYLSRRDNAGATPQFIDDYVHSLRAAFTATEWRSALLESGMGHSMPHVGFYSMRPCPVLGVLCSKPTGPLSHDLSRNLTNLHQNLVSESRSTLRAVALGFFAHRHLRGTV